MTWGTHCPQCGREDCQWVAGTLCDGMQRAEKERAMERLGMNVVPLRRRWRDSIIRRSALPTRVCPMCGTDDPYCSAYGCPAPPHADWCTSRSGGWMALGRCNCRMSPVDPREALPDREPGLMAHLIPWLIAGLIAALIVFSGHHYARATDHGFDKTDPFSQWMESLKRPDDTLPRGSCCSYADAYKIEILEDAIGSSPDQHDWGTAVITDGAPKEYPNGDLRVGLPEGMRFKFPLSKVNPLGDGNPTNTAWGFFSVIVGPTKDYRTNNIRFIYCIVPRPPGL